MGNLEVVGRLAPSPTGWLHLGHARSFLAAWWSARGAGGRVVLRIEDLDSSRARPEFVDGVLRDLQWLGLDWDGPVVLQSERREAHRAALEELAGKGLAYPCVCTRKEIDQAVSAPHGADGEVVYPGTCRDREGSPERSGWRFRLSDSGDVGFNDLLAGAQVDSVAEQVGDFVIWTKADEAAYQLAVVVDDAFQGVTEVVRGEDLLASTARQALLQEALGLHHPNWVHLPLVQDGGGRRLAKRAGSLSLGALRDSKVEPQAIVQWAAKSLGMHGEGGTAQDFVEPFHWFNVPGGSPRVPSDWL
ncbi:MAG: tRNA glutamyl-Q(34) synthetase GluQRS [bacterium]|nr:tRNA glutamyl-Q(34) synthetase GluQRS [bacterium]